jgi:uncharacterized protein (TIGR01319 family)
MRRSAVATVEEGADAGLLPPGEHELERLRAAALARHDDPDLLPGDPAEREDDEALATAAVVLALRRHAGRSQVVYGAGGRVVERTGKDLRPVHLLVGSGGVLRNNPPELAARVLGAVSGEGSDDGWQLPRRPVTVVDQDYVLAPAGLLAAAFPEAAHALLARLRHTLTP